MLIHYDSKNDLLYLRLDQKKQEVINKKVSDNVVLDLGENDKIIGIEIIDASKSVQLKDILPITYDLPKTA